MSDYRIEYFVAGKSVKTLAELAQGWLDANPDRVPISISSTYIRKDFGYLFLLHGPKPVKSTGVEK